jgi:transcriptional regulator GlxA family with amidase domain
LFFQSDLVADTLIRQKAEFCWLERVHLMPRLLREQLFWLNRLGNNCSSFSAMKADAMIGDILRDLIRDARAAAAEAERLSVSRKSTRIHLYQRLALAREWIDANYASPLTLETIAGQAALNSQHFLRMFRDCFGFTPHRYLTGIRLDVARQLLAGTTQPVSAICRLAGFESPSSFSGLFRQRYGASPRTYRQNLALPAL